MSVSAQGWLEVDDGAAPVGEAAMLDLLARRYGANSGNGPAWAFVPHVRNAAGFDACCTCDALALALWPSKGLELVGHEVKCSRSDWLRELREPAKAEAFARYCDRWWLVVASDRIVRPGELPAGWGLLVARGGRLVAKVDAPPLRDPDPLPRTMLAALLRAANPRWPAGRYVVTDSLWHRLGHPLMGRGRRWCSICRRHFERAS